MIRKNWIAGKEVGAKDFHEVFSPYSGDRVSKISIASEAQVRDCIDASQGAFSIFREIPRYVRSELLEKIAQIIADRRSDFEKALLEECGKPISAAKVEVDRAINTFKVAAHEAMSFGGELIPMDRDPVASQFRSCQIEFKPLGPVFGITPFNFPLNLVAHKVAPALAVGASIIIKPAPQAPTPALLLNEVIVTAVKLINKAHSKTEVPSSIVQTVFCKNEQAEQIIRSSIIRVVSFTGSDHVGKIIHSLAAGKKAVLELGGNAAVIVDDTIDDFSKPVSRIATGALSFAGQSCISVQRIFIKDSIYKDFKAQLVAEFLKIKSGDPKKSDTVNGPVIDENSKNRILEWIKEAKAKGAKVLCGGTAKGNVVAPTLLESVPKDVALNCKEVFGPVAILIPFAEFDQKLFDLVNESEYGLHAGVFTASERNAWMAIDKLEVGGVLINEIPTYRSDHMPYGGIKSSGLGTEGVRYAMEDYCHRKTALWYRN